MDLIPGRFFPNPSHLPGCIPAGSSDTELTTAHHPAGKVSAVSLRADPASRFMTHIYQEGQIQMVNHSITVGRLTPVTINQKVKHCLKQQVASSCQLNYEQNFKLTEKFPLVQLKDSVTSQTPFLYVALTHRRLLLLRYAVFYFQ